MSYVSVKSRKNTKVTVTLDAIENFSDLDVEELRRMWAQHGATLLSVTIRCDCCNKTVSMNTKYHTLFTHVRAVMQNMICV